MTDKRLTWWWGEKEAKEIHQCYCHSSKGWLGSNQALSLESCVTCGGSLSLYELLVSKVGTRLPFAELV